ncbi:MAG TPA: ribonuclease P protein subunit [Thermoplasmatales archaeon]|nr:ribonuclease P protein subunit [Thermoplasmatales archaeon]
MSMDEEKLLMKGELIGQRVTITSSTDPSWVGKTGVIVDETKNTFKLEINGEEKVIAKEIATFVFTKNNRNYEIEGKRLQFRPEDRIKKAR